MENELIAIRVLNAELLARIDMLENEKARKLAENAGIKKGIIIPLFKS